MVIDRIEGPTVVVEIEKGVFENVPVNRIHGHARDGAVVVRDGDVFVVDEAATASRAADFAGRRRRMFRN